MRCKKCGGMLSHALTDIFQENFYQCNTGLTDLQHIGEDGVQRGSIRLCGQAHNAKGQSLENDLVQYYSEERVQVAHIENGRFKR